MLARGWRQKMWVLLLKALISPSAASLVRCSANGVNGRRERGCGEPRAHGLGHCAAKAVVAKCHCGVTEQEQHSHGWPCSIHLSEIRAGKKGQAFRCFGRWPFCSCLFLGSAFWGERLRKLSDNLSMPLFLSREACFYLLNKSIITTANNRLE